VQHDAIWDELREKLPWHKTEEDRLKRLKLFKRIDINGNGLLSYNELEMGMLDIVKLPNICDIRPVIMRAYQTVINPKGKASK